MKIRDYLEREEIEVFEKFTKHREKPEKERIDKKKKSWVRRDKESEIFEEHEK